MKTINNNIENGVLGSMNRSFRYGVLFLFAALVATAISLFTFISGNMYHMIIILTFKSRADYES